jgi:bifunctional N-acetylglucosamine-1-phosphate-uridyltransferase/glucosamine-1-phosphate-acetyltransferase GlmU-like protein
MPYDLEVPTGFNGMLVGPVSIGGEITVASGSVLTII